VKNRVLLKSEIIQSGGACQGVVFPGPVPLSVSVPERGSLPDTWASWIKGYDDAWSWYGHFTFRKGTTKHGSVHPEKADKMFRFYVNRLNERIYGRRFRNRNQGVLVARATELGEKGGLLHYHAVLGMIPRELMRMEWKEEWNEIAGFARIFAYDRNLGGVHYLSKSTYAWKRGEIDLIGPWEYAGVNIAESLQIPQAFAVGISE
jgi:hypothetical protein